MVGLELLGRGSHRRTPAGDPNRSSDIKRRQLRQQASCSPRPSRPRRVHKKIYTTLSLSLTLRHSTTTMLRLGSFRWLQPLLREYVDPWLNCGREFGNSRSFSFLLSFLFLFILLPQASTLIPRKYEPEDLAPNNSSVAVRTVLCQSQQLLRA